LVDSSATALLLNWLMTRSSALLPLGSSCASAEACSAMLIFKKCPSARLTVIASSVTTAPGS
jgi:hypothetical protein